VPAFDAVALSCTGPRPDNQDSALAGGQLVAVADGVGGNVGGAVASALVGNWLAPLALLPAATPGPAQALREVVAGANGRIAVAVDVHPRLRTMATTLVAVLADESGVTVAHIGDSRVYLLRDGRLTQVTRDQTLVQALLDAGDITPAQAAVHPQRSVVYAALSGDPRNLDSLEITPVDARPGDRLLLCSDGLSDVVPAARLEELLAGTERPEVVARTLVTSALEAATPDNVTVVVADVVQEQASPGRHAVTAGAAAQPQPEVTEGLEALWPSAPAFSGAGRSRSASPSSRS
jgi:PPM family protein phosphatase